MFNVLAESKVKLKQFLEDGREEVFPSLSVLNRSFNFRLSFCCCREGGGLKVKNAKILMMAANASGVLRYENSLKAADTELSGTATWCRGCWCCCPQQSAGAAAALLGAHGNYLGTTQLLPSVRLMSPAEYCEGVFEHSECCARSLLVFWFLL